MSHEGKPRRFSGEAVARPDSPGGPMASAGNVTNNRRHENGSDTD